MRNRHRWMLAAAGFAAAALSSQAQAPVEPSFRPLVSIKELMDKTITPVTNTLWSAWQTPTTMAEWNAMEEAAVTLLAAASPNAQGGTGPMDGIWGSSSRPGRRSTKP